MRQRRTILGCVLLAASAWSSSARAELTPEQAKEAGVLIGRLTQPSDDVRRDARWKLSGFGPDVLPLLRRTIRETANAEVRLLCKAALRQVAVDHPGSVPELVTTGPIDKINLDASRVTIHVKDVPIGEVLWSLTEETRNPPIPVPAKWSGRKVTLDVDDMPYWQALDSLCRAAGGYFAREQYNTTVALYPGPVDPEITAYTGPVVLKVIRGSRTLHLRWPRETRSVSYHVEWNCEERLPAYGASVKVTKAVAADGHDLTAACGLATGVLPNQLRTLYGGDVDLQFDNLPPGVEGPALIEGTVTLRLCSGRKELRLNDVLTGGDRTVIAHGVTLSVRDVRKTARGAEMDLVLAHDGKHELLRDVETNVLSPYGFFMRNLEGRGLTTFVTNVRPRGKETTLTFRSSDDARFKGPWSLLYVWPQETQSREYPFRLTGLPAP